MDLINTNNLGVRFATRAGPVDALKGVSFRIREGSTVAIVGESGSGKSVTAQAIMGILPRNATITSGEILFADPSNSGKIIDLAKLDPARSEFRAIRGKRISIIFQEPMTSLSPLHTIGNQISEALALHFDLTDSQAHERCVEMLRLVNFPDAERAYKTYPFELSGGLRQRAMIAMALVCRPSLLIADEPTTALDVTIQAQILSLIQDLQSELGMAVLLITHDMGVVASFSEEVVVIYHGQVMESGMIEDIFNNATHPYLKALLQAVPKFSDNPDERLIPLREIKPQMGYLLAKGKTAKGGDTSTPVLDARDIVKNFTIRSEKTLLGTGAQTSICAVDHVSFQINQGECLGLVGESGCGKTTVSRIIMRVMDPDKGEVIFNDNGTQVDLVKRTDREMVPYRRKIQYVFQDPFGSLNPRMTVFDTLSEPLLIHNLGDLDYRQKVAMELMELVGMDPRQLNRYPHSFSGGQRQRIGIARALALQPDLLICDEPVSALDVSVQAQVLNLLKDLQDQLGLTYLFISHDLAVVKYIADRIAVMCCGRLVEIAPCDLLFQSPQHPYTQALLAAVPLPDLGHRLDFKALKENRMTEPEFWPEPYDVRAGDHAELVHLGEGHYVRVHAPSEAAE